MIAEQHAHQLGRVQPVALGPALAAVDLDAGRVDHQVVPALAGQPAVQPETVAARLVAAVHRGVLGQAETLLGLGNLLQHRGGVAATDRA